ncbi:MAG: signal peptide peptidase SppA [Caldithrix sp.]|nr:MAG: signal peptide peptidase SppA [Caldithrix sp.]
MAKKRGWLIFFILFGVFVFIGLMFIFGIMTALENRPVVRNDTVLEFNLSGLITEHFPRDAFGREFEGANLQMHDIRKALAMAKVDERIRGIYLRVSSPQIGWAKSQELRDLLFDFKESGKFVTAFMESCNEKSYYIAIAADEIYLQPHSFAEFNGFAAEIPFLKRMFNKVGAEPQVENIGKYKSAGDIYKRDSMTPAHREVTQALLDDIFEEFTQAVIRQRGIDKEEFMAAINQGIYDSEGALELNLVDTLIYETEVIDLLKKKVFGENSEDKDLRVMSLPRYAKIPYAEVGLDGGSKVALIYAIGTIVSGSGGHDPVMGRNMGSRSIIRYLRSAKKDISIKAIVIRVDSPGGSSLASDEIWSEINSVRKIKPVVISMSDVAASGGYWIAMDADAIVAQPLTITGSIGVVFTLFDLSGTYDKLGIDWETVKKGAHADMLTDKRAMTDAEWQTFKKLTRDVYDVFVQKVADGRNKSWDEIDEIAQGRIWTGEEALNLGLVDSLGGLNIALQIAKEKAGIARETQTQWLVYPQPKGLLESVFDRLSIRAAGLLSQSNHDLALIKTLPPETKSILKRIAVMRRVRGGEIMAVAPFIPEIN